MRLIAKKLVLQAMSEKVGFVLSSGKEIQPVLTNFHFEAAEGSLRMIATDLDLSVLANTELVNVSEPGNAIIPAKKFLDIVKEAGDGDIEILVENDKAKISTPATRWEIQLMSEQYPAIPSITDIAWSNVQANLFCNALKKVRLAVADEGDPRPELTLVKCGKAGVLATDGGRLHLAKLEVPQEMELRVSAVNDLIKLMRPMAEGPVELSQTDSHYLFKIGNDIFIAAKMQVSFPDVQMLLSSVTENTLELQVDRESLLQAIKRTRITADEETNRIVLVLEKHGLSLETRDKQNNWCIEKVDVHWEHEKKVFSVNYRYLQDAITEMEAANIRMLFGQDEGKRKAPIAVEEANFISILNQLRFADEREIRPAV